jgi:hypothetical protein
MFGPEVTGGRDPCPRQSPRSVSLAWEVHAQPMSYYTVHTYLLTSSDRRS